MDNTIENQPESGNDRELDDSRTSENPDVTIERVELDDNQDSATVLNSSNVPVANLPALSESPVLVEVETGVIRKILSFPGNVAKKVEGSLAFSIDLYIAERESKLDGEVGEQDKVKFASDKIILLDLKEKLLEGQLREKKTDFIAGFGALGLGYLTYAALLSGNALFLAPILAYEAIPGLGGSPALYSALYMVATFGIPETVKILRDGSHIGTRRALTGTWLRVAGALNEIGFLILPLLKDRDITVQSTRLLANTVLSRIKPIARSKNLIRRIIGQNTVPIYKKDTTQ